MYAILTPRKLCEMAYMLSKHHAPFTFAIDLVLRECDVLMIEVYPKLSRHLTQVFIGCPLVEGVP